VHSRT
jgi:hypothetical protein